MLSHFFFFFFFETITRAEALFFFLVTGGGQPGKQLFSFLHIIIQSGDLSPYYR